MPRFSANLTMMFTEFNFLDRFAAASNAGFRAVEFLFPYDYHWEQIATEVARYRLAISVFNLPPGNWSAGERGLAALPSRGTEFRASVELALPYAKAVGAERLHVMAGITVGICGKTARETFITNLKYAAQRFGEAGLDLLIEPINQRDMPAYFLSCADEAAAIIDDVGASNLKLQFDIYHHQISRGDVCRSLDRLLPYIGHVQIAGVPDRHEPDSGEVNPSHILKHLEAIGYKGWVGCEYRPRRGTIDGLAWLRVFDR